MSMQTSFASGISGRPEGVFAPPRSIHTRHPLEKVQVSCKSLVVSGNAAKKQRWSCLLTSSSITSMWWDTRRSLRRLSSVVWYVPRCIFLSMLPIIEDTPSIEQNTATGNPSTLGYSQTDRQLPSDSRRGRVGLPHPRPVLALGSL